MSGGRLQFIRVGDQWFNGDRISLIEYDARTSKVKVHIVGMEAHNPWEFEGDKAEAFLEHIGFGKEDREKEAAAKAKAKVDAEQAEAKAAEQAAAPEGEKAKGAAHKKAG